MITEYDIKKAAESFTYEVMLLRTGRTDIWERTPEGAKLLESELLKASEHIIRVLARKLTELKQ